MNIDEIMKQAKNIQRYCEEYKEKDKFLMNVKIACADIMSIVLNMEKKMRD